VIPGFTSTGSKRPDVLFGGLPGAPAQMTRASGCRLWAADGKEYLDTVMALGAVALGYGHPPVVAAAIQAVRDGTVGSLPPVVEQDLAERLASLIPMAESTRFLKTGAEAVAAAVRIARVATGRERVLTCGYHGWLDWCQGAAGVPGETRALRHEIAFNDEPGLEKALREHGPVAAIVVEPVIDGPPNPSWLAALRRVATAHQAVLVFDEIKTAFRLEVGGATARYGVSPDLLVLGKALGNGFPIAAVTGPRDLMAAASRSWISSTLATEYVSLCVAGAVLEAFAAGTVVPHLARVGALLFEGLWGLAERFPDIVTGARGMPEMCYLAFRDDALSAEVAIACARRGLLFKRSAYNFVSLAHTEPDVAEVLSRLEAALDEVQRSC
jgi:glutamate-1-semialdehyde 2,1-aminomutase